MCDEFVCVSCETAEMRVQSCVHHTWIYSVDRHRRSAGLKLLTQMICEHDLSQFTPAVRLVSAVTPSAHTHMTLTLTQFNTIDTRSRPRCLFQGRCGLLQVKKTDTDILNWYIIMSGVKIKTVKMKNNKSSDKHFAHKP